MEVETLRLVKIPANACSQYLRGPIPLVWLSRAACLSGRVLHAALALWHISMLKKSKIVKMQAKVMKAFGISRGVYIESLKKLEETDLISVERKPGSTPTVTILDPITEG